MAYLKILSGANKNKKTEIDRDNVTIGRSTDNLVSIDSPSVSGKHCQITRDGRKFTLTDLDSTNGTRLNGIKIQEFQLSPGDTIGTGDVDLLFDGKDVDDAEISRNTAESTQVTVRIEATARQHPVSGPAAFKKKKENKLVWITVFIVVGLASLAALTWFIIQLTEN